MSNKELKIELAAFKTWYVPRICRAGTYHFSATELSSGLRFAVERDKHLEEIWCKENGQYKRVI